MRGSFQLIKLFNIPVRIHWSFSLVFVFVLLFNDGGTSDVISILFNITFIIALFACVVLHEFGHALTARRFGVNTQDIILLPIGGVARLDRLPEKPMHEFYVAVAGPLVNVAIALLLLPYVFFISQSARNNFLSLLYPGSNIFPEAPTLWTEFLVGLFTINLVLAIFNLIPAFPMDGGRILRALLSLPFGRLKATLIAARVGQFLAVSMVLLTFFYLESQLMLAFVGIFVFMMASNEYQMVWMDEKLNEYRVGDLIRKTFTKIYESDSILEVDQQASRSQEHFFLVFDNWQNLKGVISEKALALALKDGKGEEPVQTIMSRNFQPVIPQDSLKYIFDCIHLREQEVFPVFEKGKLTGVLDIHMLNSFLSDLQKSNRNFRSFRRNNKLRPTTKPA